MSKVVAVALVLLSLTACSRNGDIDQSGGIAITRTACPAVAVPAYTGDITSFDPPTSRDARAIDVVATIGSLRNTCSDSGSDVVASTTFDVAARRTNATGARDVVIPYFVTVVRGGNVVVAKRISRVSVHFDAGQARATAQGSGGAVIARSAASLPKEVTDKLKRKRKATDADASIDPLSTPDVRAAVAKASFEVLVGFQMTQDQLRYNATR